jgi:hypothetical protein
VPLLSQRDLAFFAEQGYLHVEGVLPDANCRAVVDAMFEFLDMDPEKPEDWYRPPLKGGTGGMVEMYHHQSMWDNRQHPRVHQLFTDLLGTEKLLVTLDRVSFKLPENPQHPQFRDAGFLHLDNNPRDYIKDPNRLALQGVIYLTDTVADQGGFHCVPGFHKQNRAWAALPEAERPADPPDFSRITPTPILGRAGDMVIWDVLLPHGNGLNRTSRPRMAQYVLMQPVGVMKPGQLEDRVKRWRECLPTFSGDPRKIEETSGKPASLTPLGRKLLGLDPWE